MEFRSLAKQNPWWVDPSMIEQDPKLKVYDSATLKWRPRLSKYMDLSKDVLYSVRGPRQVGKTTLVKLLIKEELSHRKPQDIFYYSCDLLSKAGELYEILEAYITWSERQGDERKLIFIDEVSRVRDWEHAYKHFIDTHGISGKTFILTGSSCWDIKYGIERLPGRKGEDTGEQNHKILLPMKFAEYVMLRAPRIHKDVKAMGLDLNEARRKAFNDLTCDKATKWIDPFLPHLEELEMLLDEYFITGGVMTAVNQYVENREIKNTTYELYLQLFFGDLARLGRDEMTAKKILTAVLRYTSSTVGWTKIHKTMDIPHPVTVAEYAEALKTLFVLNIYHAFDYEHNQPKFRSEKKLQIPNPFFFHAFRGHLENPAGDYYKQAVEYLLNDGKSTLSEFVTGDHLARCAYNAHPTDLYDHSNTVFYSRNRKGEEIDYILRLPEKILPVEVKYQNRINNTDYKNIKKKGEGILVTKNTLRLTEKTPAIPLHLFLLYI